MIDEQRYEGGLLDGSLLGLIDWIGRWLPLMEAKSSESSVWMAMVVLLFMV
jgi:hypothetical protein